MTGQIAGRFLILIYVTVFGALPCLKDVFFGFARYHRVLIFCISLGIGIFGMDWVILGSYRFAVLEPDLLRLSFCLLVGAFSFAIVFALAHACYSG